MLADGGPVRTSGCLEPVLTDGTRQRRTTLYSDLIQFDFGSVLLSEPLTGISSTVRLSETSQLQLKPVCPEVQLPTLQHREEPDYVTFTYCYSSRFISLSIIYKMLISVSSSEHKDTQFIVTENIRTCSN